MARSPRDARHRWGRFRGAAAAAAGGGLEAPARARDPAALHRRPAAPRCCSAPRRPSPHLADPGRARLAARAEPDPRVAGRPAARPAGRAGLGHGDHGRLCAAHGIRRPRPPARPRHQPGYPRDRARDGPRASEPAPARAEVGASPHRARGGGSDAPARPSDRPLLPGGSADPPGRRKGEARAMGGGDGWCRRSRPRRLCDRDHGWRGADDRARPWLRPGRPRLRLRPQPRAPGHHGD